MAERSRKANWRLQRCPVNVSQETEGELDRVRPMQVTSAFSSLLPGGLVSL